MRGLEPEGGSLVPAMTIYIDELSLGCPHKNDEAVLARLNEVDLPTTSKRDIPMEWQWLYLDIYNVLFLAQLRKGTGFQ